jgi:hypothetical protein
MPPVLALDENVEVVTVCQTEQHTLFLLCAGDGED